MIVRALADLVVATYTDVERLVEKCINQLDSSIEAEVDEAIMGILEEAL